MNKHWIAAAGSLGLIVQVGSIAGGLKSFCGRQSDPNRTTREDVTLESSAQPIDESQLRQDPKEREARLAKNIRYNTDGPDLSRLRPDEHIINQTWPRTEFIPVSQSAVVVVGRVVEMQSYLSENRSQIYTEITIIVETLFKGKARNLRLFDNRVTIDLLGGAVRFKSGRVVRDDTKTEFLGRPYVGGRFVLFARGIHEGKDLSLIRAYELHDGRVFQLRDDGNPGNSLVSAVPGVADSFSQEETFLQAVRKRTVEAKQDR